MPFLNRRATCTQESELDLGFFASGGCGLISEGGGVLGCSHGAGLILRSRVLEGSDLIRFSVSLGDEESAPEPEQRTTQAGA